MASLKYFKTIEAAQAAAAARPAGPLPRFDFQSLGSRNPFARWLSRFLLRQVLPAVTAVLRLVWPTPRFGRFVLVTRRADAEEVLGDMTRFKVVYGPEMRELGGADNVLGVDDAEHARFLGMLQKALTPEDVAQVGEWVAEDAEALLDAGGGRIDVMRDLITRTATESCCRLFGITTHDPDLFAEWTMAMSSQLFGDFFGAANIRTQAQTAAAFVRGQVDDSIRRVEQNDREYPRSRRPRVTLIDRLITAGMPRDEVRAQIIGLATAFMPTNTLAGGNILEVLLESPGLMRAAREAAKAGDMGLLRAVLMEAGAANPALSPGLWRCLPEDAATTSIGAGGRKSELRPGDLILVCIPSALRDRSGPGRRDGWMMFGHGPHVCLGAELALAHLTAVFGALLGRDDLDLAPGRHGCMMRTGPYPTRLDMTYRTDNARRALMVLTLPVRAGVARRDVEAALEAVGNPVGPAVRASLDAFNRIQFFSLSVIERAPDSPESVLLIEISGDGEDGDLLEGLAARCSDWLAPIIAFCNETGEPPRDARALAAVLRRGLRPLHRWPWGSTGLHFDGLPELSVADIARQADVARFAATIVNDHLRHDLGLSTRAMDILQRTRRILKRDSMLALRTSWRERMEHAPARTAILKPGRKRLRIADWRAPRTIWEPFWRVLWSPDGRWVAIAVVVLAAAYAIAAFSALNAPGAGLGMVLFILGVALLAGATLAAITAAGLGTVFLLLVRARERCEPSDPTAPSLEQIERIAAREDAAGQAQNHIIAVMPFKRGLVRRLSFAFAMWGIKQAVSHWFRPGFVVTMGTIHKARWFRVPRTRQFVFFSNYDGSWESYLEDFITRAHQGQSAAWSHGVGFPQTRFLIGEGAKDGDRFKRWVRLQQRETRAWYSRFPDISAQQIRRNAMIEDGLARAASDTDARRWLGEFGSAQRERDELETQEGQTIIFNGFGRQTQATALFITLPDDSEHLTGWLKAVSGLEARPVSAFVGPPARWVFEDEHGPRISLPLEARVRFGEQPVSGGGVVLGLTARGLERCGLTKDCGLASLPTAFRMTMAGRAAQLGDDPARVRRWRMTDAPDREDKADAILVVYGGEHGLTHADTVNGHRLLANHYFASIRHETPCDASAIGGDLEREPFGFRDGVSQPVIAGTRRAARPLPERDVLAAGEFLLGYRNGQGFCTPAIAVGAEHDPANDLPTTQADDVNRYPWFGSRDAAGDGRDFGRNGSFLVVRQLDQDVSGFEEQLHSFAEALNKQHPGLAELNGGPVTADWVGAKIIGRWRDGTPVVGNRSDPGAARRAAVPNNDFAFGVDDPRGLACPLGSHVRRANPRDSLEPADHQEQQITNRHRLIRRGRSYVYAADEPRSQEERTGLLFMAVCADLERQFEFVQRNWLNATSFHGLVDERDPLLGGATTGGKRADGGFTIPTEAGPVRIDDVKPYVTLRGGGYFFLPSRSALAFLINTSSRRLERSPPNALSG